MNEGTLRHGGARRRGNHATGSPTGCGPLLPAPRDERPIKLRLLEWLRAAGTASRVDMARELGVSPGSITTASADLIELGLIEERASTRDPTRGRPPVDLTLTPDAAAVVGIKLSDDFHTAVILNFAGQMLGEAALATNAHLQSVDTVFKEIETLIGYALAAARLKAEKLVGVGLGLPGIVAHESGRAMWSPLLVEQALDLGPMLAERISLPVSVDNDANLLTLAELWFGAGRTMSDFVVVTVEHGVGMGLVIENRLIHGAGGFGMELGHTKVALDGALCRCGQRGCLEAYVADYALVREARTALGAPRDSTESPRALLQRLLAEAQRGHPAARSIFRRASRHLALGLSNVVQLFDPSLIILSGGQVRFDMLYSEEVIEEMKGLTLNTGQTPRVEVSARGDMVWARGAAAMALSEYTSRVVK
ncbi:MAG: ROK family transcriptional regulator [Pseudomonadota bacterium]